MATIEKTKPIKINKIMENNIQNVNKYFNDFDLKTNCFDPSKFSPPNDFIMKLNMRMECYNNFSNRLSE
jgi:hypothetical protein